MLTPTIPSERVQEGASGVACRDGGIRLWHIIIVIIIIIIVIAIIVIIIAIIVVIAIVIIIIVIIIVIIIIIMQGRIELAPCTSQNALQPLPNKPSW